MSLILTLLKNLPAIMAAIQSLIAIFTTQAAYQSYQRLAPAVSQGVASAVGDYQWYVLGQGGLSIALVLGAVFAAFGQVAQNRVYASHALLLRQREMRELQERLNAEIDSLPRAMQTALAARAAGQ